MNTQDKYPDGPPCVEARVALSGRSESGRVLWFDGGPVDTSAMRASHNGPTPTTLRNTRLARPAEQYPGEAERMIAEMTRLATASIQRARDATELPRLLAELDEAAWYIAQARRWATP